MPTLPSVKVESLRNAEPGALLSISADDGLIFGIRASYASSRNDDSPVFVQLGSANNRGASVYPILDPRYAPHAVAETTRVVNHGTNWTLHVDAEEWALDSLFGFALKDEGALLIREGGGLRLAVSVLGTGECFCLDFTDWTLSRPDGGSKYAVANKWNISMPGAGDALQWPLGKS